MYPYATSTFWFLMLPSSILLYAAVLNFFGGPILFIRTAPRRALGILLITLGLWINLTYLAYYHLMVPRSAIYHMAGITFQQNYHTGFLIYLVYAVVCCIIGVALFSFPSRHN